MTPSQQKVISAIAYMCSTGVATAEHFEFKHFGEVAKIAGTRIPWSLLSGYITDETIKSYNFTEMIEGIDPVKPQTDTNVAKVAKVAPKKKAPVAPSTDSPEIEKEDVAILDKYNDMIPEGKKYSQNVNDIIVVSKPNDGGVIGLARTFDTAWDVHKMYRFHDLGEFSDRKAVEKYFNEHGRVVLKSGNANLFVIFERMEIQI